MLRRILSIGSLSGLFIVAAVWLAAAVMTWIPPRQADGVTIGYGHNQEWLVNALIYGDGELVCRFFRPNLTHHTGIYGARVSGLRPWRGMQGSVVAANQFSRSIRLHMALPLLFLASLSFLFVGLPAIRRARRRRLGLCTRCGYDLRHAQAPACPECGHESTPRVLRT